LTQLVVLSASQSDASSVSSTYAETKKKGGGNLKKLIALSCQPFRPTTRKENQKRGEN
jgi:hypothetical protein